MGGPALPVAPPEQPKQTKRWDDLSEYEEEQAELARHETTKAANGKGDKGDKGGGKQYLTDRQGKQICFAWNRAKEGCTEGACPNNRSHLCETAP